MSKENSKSLSCSKPRSTVMSRQQAEPIQCGRVQRPFLYRPLCAFFSTTRTHRDMLGPSKTSRSLQKHRSRVGRTKDFPKLLQSDARDDGGLPEFQTRNPTHRVWKGQAFRTGGLGHLKIDGHGFLCLFVYFLSDFVWMTFKSACIIERPPAKEHQLSHTPPNMLEHYEYNTQPVIRLVPNYFDPSTYTFL